MKGELLFKIVEKGIRCRAEHRPGKRCERCDYGFTFPDGTWGCDLKALCDDAVGLLDEWRKVSGELLTTLNTLEDVQDYAREHGIEWMTATAALAAAQIGILSGKIVTLEGIDSETTALRG